MTSGTSIKIAVIASLIIHSVIFLNWPSFYSLVPKKNPRKLIEVNYFKIKAKEPAQISVIKRIAAGSPDSPPLEAQKPVNVQKPNTVPVAKPAAAKTADLPKKEPAPLVKQQKQEIVIPPVPVGVEKMPAYLDYVQTVREKIKRVANSRYRRLNSVGDVMLNFVLSRDGNLRAVKIVEERSCDDERLKNIAEEAIKATAPFESFPSDLEFRELSFSVVISFQ